MKVLFKTFLLWMLPFFALAQKSDVFRIDSRTTQGVLLGKGWKWHAGDNPDFAKPDFNDNTWESIDPLEDIMNLPQLNKDGEIFWLRLQLSVDSSINKALVMMIVQSGASEIYLNGKLIHTFGELSKNAINIKAFTPNFFNPVSFPILTSASQILAIRFAFQPHILYSSHYGKKNFCLAVLVTSVENSNKRIDKHTKLGFRIIYHIGIFSVLFLLYFSFYLFNPTQKVNLYSSIYSLLMIAFETSFMYYLNENYIEWLFDLGFISLLLQVFAYLLMLFSIYHVFEQKIDIFYWILLVLGISSIFMDSFIYKWGFSINLLLFLNLFTIDTVRVAFIAYRNKKNGAWIIVIGAICSFISWLIACLGFFMNLNTFGIDFVGVFILCIPISVAIYLGYDFALMNRRLNQKLLENETLYAEKQQMLATQNETLEQQVTERTNALSFSLKELKATQNQLIQSEKLASLGELTAGIAHEIQNPLNFVNNFAKLSVDLAKDINSEIHQSNIDKEYVEELLTSLSSNQEKISHHGNRAATIVKGMIEHSKPNTGVRELTDINKLCDEYSRLTFNGLKAKNPDLKPELITHFDESLPKIEIVPQDIGRVIVNLVNNAFYAVNERNNNSNSNLIAPTSRGHLIGLDDNKYQPTVTVTTQKTVNAIEIRVKDNGTGMSDAVKAKIFQPFFTTKPTGSGTGLGLSLAYDIISKGHGGNLKVESTEGVGTEFTIILPEQK